MRLDKLLAHTGYGTRTEVKKLLKSKVVKVDGVIAKDEKQKVDLSKQVVTVFDEVVEYREFVYLMMNKPQNCFWQPPQNDLFCPECSCYKCIILVKLETE